MISDTLITIERLGGEMSKAKLNWIKENMPVGCSHYTESRVYIMFIFPNKPEKNLKVKKPEWMV